jgi:16S rRNA (cytosine967-C5)-methyltransferase
MPVDPARETALKILYDINENGAYSNLSVNKHLEAYDFKSIDRAFITDLVYGTTKWKLTIDWMIEKFSNIRLRKLSPWVLNILRMGIYQLNYTDRIPVSAACNESVRLAKRYGHAASSSFVNAILRNISRAIEAGSDELKLPDPEKNQIEYLCIKYSHPKWMVEKWLERFGFDFTEDLLNCNNRIPDFSVRVNTQKISRDELIETFGNEGIEAVPGKYVEESLVIKNPLPVSRLETFKQGYFQIQDESSMLAAKILDPQPGEVIMDLCSAPGGKATHIAELMENKGTVLARDIHEHKINIINSAAKRLSLNIIETEVFDAAVLDERYVGKADRVLVDAPCTGFGIIRRKPDIKWSRNDGDISAISSIQKNILATASKYLKPGGTLVYSTCTIEPEENEQVVKEFLKFNKNFYSAGISQYLPKGMLKPDAEDGYIQMYPNIDGIDGFFIAKIMRKE